MAAFTVIVDLKLPLVGMCLHLDLNFLSSLPPSCFASPSPRQSIRQLHSKERQLPLWVTPCGIKVGSNEGDTSSSSSPSALVLLMGPSLSQHSSTTAYLADHTGFRLDNRLKRNRLHHLAAPAPTIVGGHHSIPILYLSHSETSLVKLWPIRHPL